MGEVIRSNAAKERIEEDVHSTLRTARGREGEIAEAANARLGAAAEILVAARAQLDTASTAEEMAYEAVLAADRHSDAVIGLVRDEIWNALGRPSGSPHMAALFPAGTETYTSGDPLKQGLLMEVLRTTPLTLA